MMYSIRRGRMVKHVNCQLLNWKLLTEMPEMTEMKLTCRPHYSGNPACPYQMGCSSGRGIWWQIACARKKKKKKERKLKPKRQNGWQKQIRRTNPAPHMFWKCGRYGTSCRAKLFHGAFRDISHIITSFLSFSQTPFKSTRFGYTSYNQTHG